MRITVRILGLPVARVDIEPDRTLDEEIQAAWAEIEAAPAPMPFGFVSPPPPEGGASHAAQGAQGL